LSAACSGFLFALTTGAQFIATGAYRKVVVVGADKMSSIVDYTDRTTCVLFGDGAGAVLLEPSEEWGIEDHLLRVDGSGAQYLRQKAGGSLNPPTHDTVDAREHFVFQDGQPVFKAAVKGMADVSYEIMERNGLSGDDVDWLVPHQANLRIIDATQRRMGLHRGKSLLLGGGDGVLIAGGGNDLDAGIAAEYLLMAAKSNRMIWRRGNALHDCHLTTTCQQLHQALRGNLGLLAIVVAHAGDRQAGWCFGIENRQLDPLCPSADKQGS
jgi:3-hydroxy-3-methylglutaryl CoA synthase